VKSKGGEQMKQKLGVDTVFSLAVLALATTVACGCMAWAATRRGSNSPDTIRGTPGADAIYGYGAADLLKGLEGRDHLYGGSGGDLLYGNASGDVLKGGVGQDTLEALRGDDRLYGGNDGQRDYLWCGSGRDVAYYEERIDRVAAACEVRWPY
jgi:Ca2+-binding RTX toxin-like protein